MTVAIISTGKNIKGGGILDNKIVLLRANYTVRLCCMRRAYDKPTARIVSSKSNLHTTVVYVPKNAVKHVSKSYDNLRYRQC